MGVPDSTYPEPLRAAFLGGGINSAVGGAHRVALELDRRFRLVAGCFGITPEINQESARAYHVPLDRTYSDLTELLKAEASNIDVVIILTPTPLHAEHVFQCLEAKVPVICEKALATSSAEIRRIKDQIEQNNLFLAVTYNYSGYPMLRELRRMIQSSRLGRIEQIHVEMPQEGFVKRDEQGNPYIPQDWRLHDGALPTLSLDLGVHLHQLIDFMTGEKPLELVAAQQHFGAFTEVVDNVICMANYTHDMVANIWFSKTALGHRNGLRVRVYGDRGSAEWFQMEPETLQCSDEHGSRFILDRANPEMKEASLPRYTRFKAGHPAGYIEAFANLYADIADALIDYRKLGATFENNVYVDGVNEALDGLVLLEAITKSAVTKSWVEVK